MGRITAKAQNVLKSFQERGERSACLLRLYHKPQPDRDW